MKTFYELVTKDNAGKLHATMTDLASIQSLVVGIETNSRLRQELQGQPVLLGYLGPMWGGFRYKQGNELIPTYCASDTIKETCEQVAIVRYETQSVYNTLSV